MKICVFCHDSFNSGANMSLYDWINSDKENNYTIIIPRKNKMMQENFKNDNVNVVVGNYFFLVKELYNAPLKYKLKKYVKGIYMFFFKNLIIKRLKKIIRNNDIDIIISNTFALTIGAEIAKSMNIKHIWHVREFMELDHKITHYNIKKVNELCNYSNAIFISDVIKQYYMEHYNFNSYKVIYDQVKIDKNYNLSKKIPCQKAIKIIMVGMLASGKGQKEAIKAVELIHEKGLNIFFDIYGLGNDYNELKSYLNDKKIDYIHLKGFARNITDLRQNYDFTLVCSKNEALGRVTIEGMYYGNLVIGSDTGCTKNIIIDKENGFLYKNGDSVDLANKIIYAYKESNYNEIINNAQEYAINRFSKPIYEDVIKYIKTTMKE